MTTNRYLLFSCGLGMGALAALLWAPATGAKTRARVGRTAKKTQLFVQQQAGDLTDTVTRGKQALKRTADGVMQAFK